MDRPAQTIARRSAGAALALSAILIAGCGAGGEGTRDGSPAAGGDPLTRFESDFRPSDHDTLPAPPAHTGTAQAEGKGTITGTTSPAAGDDELVPGFRVQIFATTDIDAAKEKKVEAESDFPAEWFYLQYDPPTYKIRGGNFLQRYEAERFVKLAVEKGFSDSWAVPEKVLKQPPPPNR